AVTLAWESVHAAEGELIEVESEAAVRSNLPHLVAWMAEVLEKSPQRDGYESALNAFADGTKPLNRTLIRQAHRDVTLANNERHASLRTFRNLLIAATGVLAALLFALALWHAINHQVVSLCGGPQTGARAARTCLSGPAPAGRDIFVVELIGAIAGMLSVAFALGALKTPPSRYNVRAAQAALKPVAGAATALIGVLLVQSHILIAPATSTSGESLLLAYAAVFGFSQQLLTQFVDKRAGALLGPSGSTPDANKAGT
ncbi:MAG: hypothetical protein QOG68_406, partial [Solirubrobacteraceae bacterium]|nr:hypothetical protein [Solirubrobacteraceae bacterium]